MAETGVEWNSLSTFSTPINVFFFSLPLLKTSLGLLASWGYLECSPGFPVDSTFKESKYEIAKHSAFNRRRSHYDFRSVNFFGVFAVHCRCHSKWNHRWSRLGVDGEDLGLLLYAWGETQ